jgi:hypothetical protein
MLSASLLIWLGAATTLWAGGPRWVTGAPYFTTSGVDVVWYTNQPLYFTDPGDLSATVNHAAADALVAAAASVWNVPTSSLVLAQGGNLNEHVSGANSFLGSSGVIFPSDVQSSNYQSVQIAVIYDSDGSVTDLLLGDGASDPSGCLQNGVTESVDSIVPSGFIQHAVLILNGRCTGTDPNEQTQMQYQLMRAFGRVLGLGWSQTNDNVFTGAPQPTINQAMNWPVMHPIDIICGPYTFQCMPEPFTLRPDDLSALAELYFLAQGTAPAGKMDSLLNAMLIDGLVSFPSGQGMQGVNVVARRWAQDTDASEIEQWYTASSVTGNRFRRSNGNPVTGPDTTFNGGLGTSNSFYEGYYYIQRTPMLPGGWQNVILETEPINPLYTGQYAVGPYTSGTVEPSGSDVPQTLFILFSYLQFDYDFMTGGAASGCDTAADGTESSPAAAPATGWWTDQICGYGHTAWNSLDVKAGRSLTVEVTAEDEQGFATTAKAMPVIGIWNATDAIGSLPGVAAAGEPFNGEATGMTTLSASFRKADQLRFVVGDQRGDGRPDFNYQARVLYADSVSPATISPAGGTITITGMGFRTGNTVTINGVAATVTNWTANTIVAVAPSLSVLGRNAATAASVVVTDLSTGGTTTMTRALNYSAPVTTLNLLTAPSGKVIVGQPSAVPFAVEVISGDGVTPVVGEAVTFAATSGTVQFAACGSVSPCTVNTDAHGIASTQVTALAQGVVMLQASGVGGTANASFTAIARTQTVTPVQSALYVAAGAVVSWPLQVNVSDNAASTAGLSVSWQTVSGSIVAAPAQSLVSGQGIAQSVAMVGPLASGAQATLFACAWTTVCATFTAQAVDPGALSLIALSGSGQTIPASGSFTPVILQVIDGASHPVVGALVQIYQTVDAWQPACPDRGRCPIPPVLASSQYPLTSDINGLVTIFPEHLASVAGTTNLAAATGTQGFLSLSLQSQP